MSKKTKWTYVALGCLFAAATTHAGGHQSDGKTAAIKDPEQFLGHSIQSIRTYRVSRISY